MQLEAREKRFLIVGSIIIVLLLAYLLWPSSSAPQSSVELVQANRRVAGGTPAPAPTPSPPPPVPVETVAAPPPAATAAPPAATMPGGIPPGLTLTGIAGDGAIFSMADGSQRYIPRGRELAPGVTLAAVRLREVLLAAGTTNYRLGFGGMPVVVGAPTAGAPVAASQPAPVLRAKIPAMQSGLIPRQVGGRISGYYVRSVDHPALQGAGIQPGDIILSVNGAELGPMTLQQLAGTTRTQGRAELEVERGGQRLHVAVETGR